ncbi:unnamed protein product [Leptidea sinapis]|uniref:Uncharacterized protein n=1 Tax=Leptidea sinapis TaxID=189913 RepID=A0A5E4QEI1_9NEOP|nr:unnamed protein product [Leptidea sinapis]
MWTPAEYICDTCLPAAVVRGSSSIHRRIHANNATTSKVMSVFKRLKKLTRSLHLQKVQEQNFLKQKRKWDGKDPIWRWPMKVIRAELLNYVIDLVSRSQALFSEGGMHEKIRSAKCRRKWCYRNPFNGDPFYTMLVISPSFVAEAHSKPISNPN